ncbi:MAG: UDP-N-acetylmuramoyl-L-alanyl-D-glutamate--2,6-diaminopimelate ligase, partial [Opitutales bacterium]
CGLIGTVEYDLGDRVLPATRTTPESPELHEAFAAMARAGCEFCVMEVSSHALAQHRVAGLEFSGAVFTNLTQDHLDYHGDMAGYFAVKRQLFEMTRESAVLVANADDDFGKQLAQDFTAKTFGETEADFQVAELNLGQTESRFRIAGADFRIPLIGRHNISNAAAAIALARGLGFSSAECAGALATTEPVPGRLEPIPHAGSFAVFVDYAHTDDALRQVLGTLREITPGKLRVLFGCGGNRDASKRFKMGAAAAELAEAICITTDNPRRENPETIARQVAEGCASIRAGGWRMEPDRERAIDEILREAEPGDTVLIAGKGHETYQEIDDTIFPFDDRETVRVVLAAIEEAC